MKPSLQFRLSQHLTLTPQLQQSIRLLQLSTVELNQEIDRLLMENPALEREDVEESGEAPQAPVAGSSTSTTTTIEAAPAPETDWASDLASNWRTNESGDEEGEKSFTPPDTPTLHDHLRAQLSLTKLSPRDRSLVNMLIESLDDDGRLTQPLEEIAAMVPPEHVHEDVPVAEELSTALHHLQNFEPAGVGARSLSECVCLQLKNMPDDSVRALALKIAEQHLPLLGARDYSRLKGLTGASDEELRAVQKLINCLNPRPGAAFTKAEARYVVPDVIVKKVRNAWRASLNPDAMPRLRINRLYAEIAAGARSAGSLSTQLQEARWLIKNVQQRFDTILRVSQAIIDRQRHFFEHGEVAMKPLILKTIAEVVGTHESTISRVTTQKYMATPRGTFELKYFFGSHVATDAGGAASSTAIRALIKQLVANENAKSPLSDSRISQILGEQGVVVARRTIAKYREALQIPAVNQRKAL